MIITVKRTVRMTSAPKPSRRQIARIGPETISSSDRSYRKLLEENCRIGGVMFVVLVRGRSPGATQTTGDDPRWTIWFP